MLGKPSLLSRQFVITFIAVFTLFFTSVAVSVQANEQAEVNLSSFASQGSNLIHPLECPKPEHSEQQSSHHCCASICLLKMPCAQTLVSTYSPPASLALIGQDDNQKAIARVKTLFRPPIA
ncbi:hypothetical protein [Vibrio atypicus]|uniref:hypothetical protein n=1 Tax=Vibrio atypicus TaxID=558271 RepID=UPI001CED1368|nr:hypothetical protein [Vibrio atypicus]